MKSEDIHLTLPHELLKEIDIYCKITNRNRSELIRELLRDRLDEAKQRKII